MYVASISVRQHAVKGNIAASADLPAPQTQAFRRKCTWDVRPYWTVRPSQSRFLLTALIPVFWAGQPAREGCGGTRGIGRGNAYILRRSVHAKSPGAQCCQRLQQNAFRGSHTGVQGLTSHMDSSPAIAANQQLTETGERVAQRTLRITQSADTLGLRARFAVRRHVLSEPCRWLRSSEDLAGVFAQKSDKKQRKCDGNAGEEHCAE